MPVCAHEQHPQKHEVLMLSKPVPAAIRLCSSVTMGCIHRKTSVDMTTKVLPQRAELLAPPAAHFASKVTNAWREAGTERLTKHAGANKQDLYWAHSIGECRQL